MAKGDVPNHPKLVGPHHNSDANKRYNLEDKLKERK
jgi:hypothetical protein